jgi:hypothetical protein
MKNIVHVIYPDEAVHSFVMDTDMVVSDILERVFAEWNHGSGMESELFIRSNKRSLSVNDIVCVNGKYYLCKSFGWNEVTSQFVNELEEEVRNHPNRIQGAWFALNGVMQGMRARETKNNLELL